MNATLMRSNLPWDVTAGLLLVREAGGFVCDYDGSSHDPDGRFTIASVPSLVEPVRTYTMKPGDQHLYDVHDVHSPRRDGPCKLIRIEGKNLDRVKRTNIKAK